MMYHVLAFPCRALDGAHNPGIGAAAAYISRHMAHDLIPTRILVLCQKINGAHYLTGLAITALRHVLHQPCLLNRMIGIRRQTFDCGYRFALNKTNRSSTGKCAIPIDMDHACAAHTDATAEFRPCKPQLLAYYPKQRDFRIDLDTRRMAIHGKRDSRFLLTHG